MRFVVELQRRVDAIVEEGGAAEESGDRGGEWG
jgi:hypothetical protein